MNLKKNEILELKKAGQKAIETKLKELRLELGKQKLESKRGALANPASPRNLRRAIARLMTISQELRGNN